MNTKIIAFIAIVAFALFAFNYITPGSSYGGTVLTVNQVGYTNDPNVPFTKEYQANVVLDGGANYLMGATSASIQAPDAAKKFSVNFKLNDLTCNYPLAMAKNTLSGLAVNNYQPPNANSIYDALSPPWTTACRANAIASNFLLSNHVYKTYGVGSDSYGNTLYCNVMPTNTCKNDFKTICELNSGFKAIPCQVPNSQTDATLQAIFGSQPYQGLACIRIADHNTAVADYTIQEATSKSVKLSADVTVTKEGAASETIHLTEANSMSGNTADVYARSSFTVNSYNPDCSEYSDTVYVQGKGKAGANTKSEYTSLKAAYDDAKDIAGVASDTNVVMAKLNTFNTRMNAAFSQVNSAYSYQSGSLVVDRSANPPQLPVIQLYINADWLGIVNPVAMPQLGMVSPNPVTFTSGQQAQANIPVINMAGTTGAIQVSLPICTPTASFTWVNDPNRAYAPGESYTGTFSASASQGSYACLISAKSGGFITSGNYNPTSTTFTMNVAGICTNPASSPRYRCGTTAEPCKVCCPLDPAIAGYDVCAQSGQNYNAGTCACDAKPDCSVTNTCPICTACNDGTNVGICVANQQIRCKVADKHCNLVADTTCPGVPDNSTTPQCLPLVQKLVPITTGGLFGIGGTTVYTCENDLFGMVIAAVVILGGASLLIRKRIF